MEFFMKDAEDEAFDDLSRRQGAWGGGFDAKRKAAADKLQETVSFPCCGYTDAIKWNQFNGVVQCHMCGQVYTVAQPAQEPVARVTGVYGGRFTYDPINRAMVLPIGMALYSIPPQRPWVGLTIDEKDMIVDASNRDVFDAMTLAEAKLKEKNNG
jgi:hypothetical protein